MAGGLQQVGLRVGQVGMDRAHGGLVDQRVVFAPDRHCRAEAAGVRLVCVRVLDHPEEILARALTQQRAADVTVLILWGHGMKDPAGIGTDLTAEKQTLTLAEIASAVERSRVQVDVIGMDACSMAGAETVRAMKGSCGYLVVSEDEEALEGWPYHHLAEIMTGNAEQIAMNMADCVNTDRIRKGKPAGLTVIRMNGEEREP